MAKKRDKKNLKGLVYKNLFQRITCTYCGGKGYTRSWLIIKQTCPKCQGTGKVYSFPQHLRKISLKKLPKKRTIFVPGSLVRKPTLSPVRTKPVFPPKPVPVRPPWDPDGDGIPTGPDKRPYTPGNDPFPFPHPVPPPWDSDGDGIPNGVDKKPWTPGNSPFPFGNPFNGSRGPGC